MKRLDGVILAAMVSVTGCAALHQARPAVQPAIAGAAATVSAGYQTLSIDALHALPAAQRPRLIDVRQPDEFASGHVPGAVNVPLATVAAWSTTQAPDTPLLIICQSGRRSAVASQTLVDKGFKRVTNVEGGTGAWIERGYPVER